MQDKLLTVNSGGIDRWGQTSTALKPSSAMANDEMVTELRRMVGGREIDGRRDLGGRMAIPPELLNTSLVHKLIVASYEPIVRGQKPSGRLSKSDVEAFINIATKKHSPRALDVASSDASTTDIVRSYLVRYYSDGKDGFVDREGLVYKRPEVKKAIGNDIITATVAITLEGVFDFVFKNPVYRKGKAENSYLTIKGATPTCRSLKFVDEIDVLQNGDKKFGENEVKVIRYLSGTAADQSKVLSGIAVRSLGKINIGFVVGGGYSFGDNETFTKIVDTIFEISSKRISEAGAYYALRKMARRGFQAGTKVGLPQGTVDENLARLRDSIAK